MAKDSLLTAGKFVKLNEIALCYDNNIYNYLHFCCDKTIYEECDKSNVYLNH